MERTQRAEWPVHYRSRAWTVVYGVWGVVILTMAIAVAWGMATGDEPPWFFVAWMLGVLALGIHTTALKLTVAADGEMTFRYLHRRRRRNVADLTRIRDGNGCMVFKFTRGGTMLAGSRHSHDGTALLDHIRELNPAIRTN